MDSSFLIHRHQLLWMKTSPLLPLMTKLKLKEWHYHLVHLSFQKLKQLALNGEIPKKLSKLKPPKCTGCLFGAMTKLPWRGKESESSHEIFVAAKPGEIVSVYQMESTEVGFFMQLKGSLTKKQYRYCTVLWTTSPDCILCTSKLTTPPQRPCLPSQHLRSLQPSTVSTSYTITVITDNFLAMPGSNHARPAANDLLSAECMLISRMKLLSAQFGICQRAHASSYSMLVLAGQQRCMLRCGHMPCAMLPFSTTVCQCWRMGHQGLSYSSQFK
jgi:hypothetical protein